MNCIKFKKLIDDYIGDRLSKEKHDEMKIHQASCSECSHLYQQVKQTLDLLKPTKEIPEQAFYYTRLKQKIKNRTTPSSIMNGINYKKALQPVLYLATIFIAVYIGILIGSNAPSDIQYTDLDTNTTPPLENFAEYTYLNDLEMETIENLLIEEE